MQRIETRNINLSAGNPRALMVIAATWVAVVIGVGLWLIFDNDKTNPFREFYILPWTFLATVIVFLPAVYLFYKGKLDLFHPLVFATWMYIWPCLIFGSVIISAGWANHFFLYFIQDPEWDMPLTLVYIALGYIGLMAGFALPVGRIIGETIDRRFLPDWQWSLNHTWVAGYILVTAGVLVNIFGFVTGLLGFQKLETVEIFDGLIFFLLIMFFQGYFLLWYALFKTPNKDASYLITLVVLILMIPARMAVMGNRGSMFVCMLPILFAYLVSGNKITVKRGLIFFVLLASSIFIGIVYGTTFREIKGSETRVSSGDYLGQVYSTVDYLSTKDIDRIVQEGFITLALRLENLSSLAVIVSNYEKLEPYEKLYGLDNNIQRDTYTALVPRFIWTEKPLTSDAHAYSELYFDYGDNSFAITPFGDLLRNFGPVGVPLGMALIGVFLRVLHASLGQLRPGGQWRSAAYYILLTSVSYESFYATLLPSLIRVSVLLTITLYLTNLIAKRTGKPWKFKP